MGKLIVVCFHIWSSEGGSSRLCQLRTVWLSPEDQALIMYSRIQDLWGPKNLVALKLLSWMIPYHS
jgi:hypothetical protein